jgi:hypothetical protein
MVDYSKTLSVGSNLNALDIFLNVDGAAINASGVLFYVYDAANVLAASGIPTNPAVGQYQGSGTIPAGFSLGVWRMDWAITPVGGGEVTASEQFVVQAMNISFTLNPPTDVVTSIYDKIRLDVGDSDGLIFIDSYLQRIVAKAATRLNNKLGLSTTPLTVMNGIPGQFGGPRIQVLHLTIDFEAGTITPPGDTYEDLLILQSEYIIATSEIAALKRLSASAASGPAAVAVLEAVNDDVSVRNADGVQVSIGGGRLQTRANLYKFHAESLAKELDDAVRRFLNRMSGRFGKCVY